ncbi:MAG: hypothetical protein JRG73_18940 [Deltaproteobacteria bacterium]|nr:hypothetical protein [Deltaproteobacteria bacterium]
MWGGYEILEGAIDMHIHCNPDIVKRPQDEYEICAQASEVGYRGIVLKQATFYNAGTLPVLNRLVHGIEIGTGIVLNHWVGGLNPEAVYCAIALGAKIVWMPTYHAEYHLKVMGRPLPGSAPKELEGRSIKGIRISMEGKLFPQIEEICEIIAAKDVILATGHLAWEEIELLVTAAVKKKVNKILITHAEHYCPRLSIEQQAKLAKMGAFIEHSFSDCMPVYQAKFPCPPELIAEGVRRVGADRCIMSTDLGQMHNAHPIEGMRMFVQTLLRIGFKERDIDLMLKKTPADLLGWMENCKPGQ